MTELENATRYNNPKAAEHFSCDYHTQTERLVMQPSATDGLDQRKD